MWVQFSTWWLWHFNISTATFQLLRVVGGHMGEIPKYIMIGLITCNTQHAVQTTHTASSGNVAVHLKTHKHTQRHNETHIYIDTDIEKAGIMKRFSKLKKKSSKTANSYVSERSTSVTSQDLPQMFLKI